MSCVLATGLVDVSIVNHAHGTMVGNLVAKLQLFPEVGQIILTRNIPDNDGVVEAVKTSLKTGNQPQA